MIEFAYNNIKNSNTADISFKLNCGFYPRVSYKEDIDTHSMSKTIDQLATKL